MVDVVLSEVKYIPGIPTESTAKAIEAGALEQTKQVGLMVFLAGKPEEKIYVDLILDDKQQAKLLRQNAVLPIEQSGISYRLLSCWRDYAGATYAPHKNTEKKTLPVKSHPILFRQTRSFHQYPRQKLPAAMAQKN